MKEYTIWHYMIIKIYVRELDIQNLLPFNCLQIFHKTSWQLIPQIV